MADIKTLWKTQNTEGTVTLANIHDNAAHFERRVRRRNMREYIAAAIAVAVLGLYVWRLPGLLAKAGSALCIAGVLYVVWQLHSRASADASPDDSSAVALVDFHRRMLIRQRDALRTVWRWYLAPLVPGMLVLLTGVYFGAVGATRVMVLSHILTWVLPLFILAFGGVWWLNAGAARRLQRRIDELDELK